MDQFQNRIVNLEPLLLNDPESYFNWIESNFNVNTAKIRIEKRQCPRVCLDFKECHFCQFDGDWRLVVEPTMFLGEDTDEIILKNREKGFFNKFIAWNCEMAFLEGYIGELEKALKRLDYMDLKIDEYFCQDDTEDERQYLNGYIYLIRTLNAYFLNSEFGDIPNFDDLHVQAKIAVLSVKYNFYNNSRGSFEAQVKVLRKLVELDPLNPVWYEKLGVRLRCIKKDTSFGHKIRPPTSEETIALVKAYKLRPQEPKFFVSLSRSIAETLKAKNYKSLDQIIDSKFTFDLFKTVQDALDFMKKYTNFLLDAVDSIESKRDFSEMVRTMGEVFSVSLPPQFHDLVLAEQCILIAMEVSPACSKANHRMGLFQWVQRNNYESALKYLAMAVNCKTGNFYAMIDWCELLMHKVNKHRQLLEEIFNEIFLKEFSWNKTEIARLHFLRGCFQFILKAGDKKTINAWIKAYKIDDKSSHIIVAFIAARRFKWNDQIFNPEKIRLFLKKFRESENKEIAGRIVTEINRFY